MNLFVSEKSMMRSSMCRLVLSRFPRMLPVPILLRGFAMIHFACLDKFPVPLGTSAGLVRNYVGVLCHWTCVQLRRHLSDGGNCAGHRCRLGPNHHRDQRHAAARALTWFVLMDVAVLRHWAGVILQLPARLDAREHLTADRHQRHAAKRAFARMVVF